MRLMRVKLHMYFFRKCLGTFVDTSPNQPHICVNTGYKFAGTLHFVVNGRSLAHCMPIWRGCSTKFDNSVGKSEKQKRPTSLIE